MPVRGSQTPPRKAFQRLAGPTMVTRAHGADCTCATAYLSKGLKCGKSHRGRSRLSAARLSDTARTEFESSHAAWRAAITDREVGGGVARTDRTRPSPHPYAIGKQHSRTRNAGLAPSDAKVFAAHGKPGGRTARTLAEHAQLLSALSKAEEQGAADAPRPRGRAGARSCHHVAGLKRGCQPWLRRRPARRL